MGSLSLQVLWIWKCVGKYGCHRRLYRFLGWTERSIVARLRQIQYWRRTHGACVHGSSIWGLYLFVKYRRDHRTGVFSRLSESLHGSRKCFPSCKRSKIRHRQNWLRECIYRCGYCHRPSPVEYTYRHVRLSHSLYDVILKLFYKCRAKYWRSFINQVARFAVY